MDNQKLTISEGIDRAKEVLTRFENKRLDRIHAIVAEQRATIRENLLEGIDDNVDKHVNKTNIVINRLDEIGTELNLLDKKIQTNVEKTSTQINRSINSLKQVEDLIGIRVQESINLLKDLETQNSDQTESNKQYQEDLNTLKNLEEELEEIHNLSNEYTKHIQQSKKENKQLTKAFLTEANTTFRKGIKVAGLIKL